MTTEPTPFKPLPWRQDPDNPRRVLASDGRTVADCGSKRDAAYIVHTVNNFEHAKED